MNNLSKFILISSRSRRIKLFNLFSAEFFLELHLLAASEKLYLLEEFQNLYMGWCFFIFARNWYWFSSKFVLSITILFCYESPIMTDRYFASLQELWNDGLYCYCIDTLPNFKHRYTFMEQLKLFNRNAKTFQTRRELSMTSICGRK